MHLAAYSSEYKYEECPTRVRSTANFILKSPPLPRSPRFQKSRILEPKKKNERGNRQGGKKAPSRALPPPLRTPTSMSTSASTDHNLARASSQETL
jgi:hypothetical protein